MNLLARFTSKKDKADKPQIGDKGQLAEAIAELGRLQREIDSIENEYNDAIAPLTQTKTAKVAPLADAMKALSKNITEYAEANKQALLMEAREDSGDENIKTVNLGTGKISWRLSTPRVEFSMGELRAAQELMEKGLNDYVAISYSIPKEAVRKDYEVLLNAGIESIRLTSVKDKISIIPHFQELT